MPKVGNKHFPYTKKGIRDAEKYAEMTGASVDTEYKEGGSVFNRQGGRVPGMQTDLPQASLGGGLKRLAKKFFGKRATTAQKKLDALRKSQKAFRNQPKVKFEGKTIALADVPKNTKRFHAVRKAKESIAKNAGRPFTQKQIDKMAKKWNIT